MNLDSSKPLYRQVEADIKSKIVSKVYVAGEKMPTENELSEQYNVSKITIRKAIQNLSDEGYVKKVQGKGTFITYKKEKMYLNKPRGFKETLSSKGHSSKNDIIQASFLNADGDISEKLSIPLNTKVVYLERLVWEDNEPITGLCRFPCMRKMQLSLPFLPGSEGSRHSRTISGGSVLHGISAHPCGMPPAVLPAG